ncbi:MAG: TolC family protein [Desulfobulbaceae bacterium]|nr:MAG: TolC family protein [Desulfobulbaceae bacterium]
MSRESAILKMMPALGLLLFLGGCVTPDYWFDLPVPGAAEKPVPPTASFTLTGPQWQEPPLLPATDNNTLNLSLEQAIIFALRHNRQLQVNQFQPLIAGTFEAIERGVYDPELFAELLYSEETASETSRSTGERFSVEGEDVDTIIGLRQKLPTGTELSASMSHRRSTSDRTPKQQEARLGLTITQSLLAGFGPAVNMVDIGQAHLADQASLYELRGFIEALVAEVETTYWKYVLAEEGIAIFKRSLTVAQQQLDEVEKRIEVGVLPRNAAAAAKAEVALRQQALIDSRSTREKQRLRLLQLINAGNNDQLDLQITATGRPQTATSPFTDLSDRLLLAQRLRPDLAEARLRLQQQRLEVIRTKNGLLPKLQLFIDVGKTGYAGSFHNAVQDFDRDNYELSTGIMFSSLINNRRAQGHDLAARASAAQAKAALINLRNLVELDVRLALNETERCRRQITAGAVTRSLQEQTLQAEQERFAIGASTSLLVAQAQRDLLISQLAEIEAVVNYRIALVNLYLAEGSLLDRRGINTPNIGYP